MDKEYAAIIQASFTAQDEHEMIESALDGAVEALLPAILGDATYACRYGR